MDKPAWREHLQARYRQLQPGGSGTPLLAGASQAAEQLRRLPAYRQARTIAVGPEPALLQVRINALMDGKNLLAATPGLKRGLVRFTPAMLPVNRRFLDLRGHAMFGAGKPLPLPRARWGKADMLVATALAASSQGFSLSDGRGLLDVFCALLSGLETLAAQAPVVLLLHQEQLTEELPPPDPWDAAADIIITPPAILRPPPRPRPGLMPHSLSPALSRLPLIKAFLGMNPGFIF